MVDNEKTEIFEGTEERSVREGRTFGFNFLLNPGNVAHTEPSLSVSADAIRLEFYFRSSCFKWGSNYRKVQCPACQTFWIHKIHGNGNVSASYWMTIFAVYLICLNQCFSNRVPRSVPRGSAKCSQGFREVFPGVPRSVPRGSERRQHVMAEQFYWLS